MTRTLTSMIEDLASGRATARELVEECLAAAEADTTNSIVQTLAESARAAADEADRARSAGQALGVLHGIPLGIKENIDIAGVETCAGSRVLAGRVPERDARVVQRLKASGAIPVATLAMHEFAHGVTSESQWRPPVRNAWDRERYAGGSSGGSAAAVAAGVVPASLGTDTGGSVRVPAALNGLTGLRPTLGSVDGDGIVPLAWTLDTCGPIARTADDVAAMFSVMSGDSRRVELRDATVAEPLRGVTIGMIASLDMEALEQGVMEQFHRAQEDLVRLGAVLNTIEIPGIEVAHSAMMLADIAEPSAVHAKWISESAQLYADDIRTLIYAGRTITAVEYLQAQQTRQILARAFDRALTQVDAILTPMVGFVAPKIGIASVTLASGVEESMIAAAMRYSAYASAAGLPAISLPCGVTSEGLPAGLQLIGARHDEARLTAIGAAYQRGTDWHRAAAPNEV